MQLIKTAPYTGPLDRSQLYRSLGSFWNAVYPGREMLRGFSAGQADGLVQLWLDLSAKIAAFSVEDCPLVDVNFWRPIRLRKSQFKPVPVLCGDGHFTGPQPSGGFVGGVFKVGDTLEGLHIWRHPIDNVVAVGTITDRILAPDIIFAKGLDFQIKNNFVYFNSNLFENSTLKQLPLPDGDLEIILWGYQAETKSDDFKNNFSKLFGKIVESDENFKKFLTAVTHAHSGGASFKTFLSAAAMAANVPLVINDSEIVEEVSPYRDGHAVITNRNSYFVGPEHTVAQYIVPGVELQAGTPLAASFALYDAVSKPSWWDSLAPTHDVAVIAIPSGMFTGVNQPVYIKTGFAEITRTDTPDGVRVNFPISGPSEAVKIILDGMDHAAIAEDLGLVADGDSVLFSPFSYLASRAFGSNMVAIFSEFQDEKALSSFTRRMAFVSDLIPAHCVLLVIANLRGKESTLEIPAGSGQVNPISSLEDDGFSIENHLPLPQETFVVAPAIVHFPVYAPGTTTAQIPSLILTE